MGQEKQDHGHREPEVPETKVSLTATKKKSSRSGGRKKKKKNQEAGWTSAASTLLRETIKMPTENQTGK